MSEPDHRPTFEKSPAALVERFAETLADRPAAARRPMFGYPCAFVNGNLTTGLFADGWFVRLPEDDAATLLAMDGARPFEPMPGRPMRGYVVLPPSVVADASGPEEWVDRAIAYVAALPSKPSKAPKASKAPKG